MKVRTPSLFLHSFPRLAFFSYVHEVSRQLADCKTCLDLGCGAGSPVRLLDFEYSVGLEGHEQGVHLARAGKTHTEVRLGDVRQIDEYFSAQQFDCVVALDLIEHLTKDEGLKLINAMERIASKKILIFTPNGFLPQQGSDGDLQEHHSGWDAREMQSLGFNVLGMHGHKSLRGEHHRHRIRPQALGGVISVLTHYLYSRRHPENAAALLCVKKVT